MDSGNGPLRRNVAGTGMLLDRAPDGPDAALTLAARLAAALLGREHPWTLEHDSLGRPGLRCPESGAPAAHVSFSRLGGVLWCAVGPRPLGLDVAEAREFGPGYPLDRVFGVGERRLAERLGVAPAEAQALLWALKEAAAKALGTGFHLLEPCDMTTESLRPADGGFEAAVRVPAGIAPGRAERVDGYWLALALTPGGPEERNV
ncbi:4'-phosphopantetheinyl transferase superfamily protein [Desulfovibrio sp.]